MKLDKIWAVFQWVIPRLRVAWLCAAFFKDTTSSLLVLRSEYLKYISIKKGWLDGRIVCATFKALSKFYGVGCNK